MGLEERGLARERHLLFTVTLTESLEPVAPEMHLVLSARGICVEAKVLLLSLDPPLLFVSGGQELREVLGAGIVEAATRTGR